MLGYVHVHVGLLNVVQIIQHLQKAQQLRQQCPCAGCVDEWTNKRTLDPARVPADVISGWRDGDPAAAETLARLELEQLGLRPPPT